MKKPFYTKDNQYHFIEVGTPATIVIGTDLYPAFVVKTTEKTVDIQRAISEPDKGFDILDKQNFIIKPDPKGRIQKVRKDKRGHWKSEKCVVKFGRAIAYQDPCF